MPFKPKREPSEPDFKRLLSTLNHSPVREKDNALYEVIRRLLENGNQQSKVFANEITKVNQAIQELSASAGGGGGEDGGVEPPIVAAGYYAPVTNGNPIYPEIVFDSTGEVVMAFVSV